MFSVLVSATEGAATYVVPAPERCIECDWAGRRKYSRAMTSSERITTCASLRAHLPQVLRG